MSCDAQEQHEGISGPSLSNHGPGQKSVLGPLLPFFIAEKLDFFQKKAYFSFSLGPLAAARVARRKRRA